MDMVGTQKMVLLCELSERQIKVTVVVHMIITIINITFITIIIKSSAVHQRRSKVTVQF